jgi:hypothetical protein
LVTIHRGFSILNHRPISPQFWQLFKKRRFIVAVAPFLCTATRPRADFIVKSDRQVQTPRTAIIMNLPCLGCRHTGTSQTFVRITVFQCHLVAGWRLPDLPTSESVNSDTRSSTNFLSSICHGRPQSGFAGHPRLCREATGNS